MKRIILILIWGLGTMILATGQEQQAGELLSKAVYEEEVNGELEKAIEGYQTIVTEFPNNRPVAAKAYFHMGMCYEKLGKEEASKAYRQVVQKYADQSDLATEARIRLAALEEPGGPEVAKNLAVRQVWSGPDVGALGSPSPNGRYFTYTDWATGDLAIRELASGKMWRLTNTGTLMKPMAFALNSKISRDNKLVAYSWMNQYGTFDLRLIGIDGSADERRPGSDGKSNADLRSHQIAAGNVA